MPVRRRRADPGRTRGVGEGKPRRALFRDQPERCLQQRLFQIAVMITALGAAFLAPAHVKGFYMSRTQRSLAHVRAKWDPVRRQGHAPTLESTAFSVHMGSQSDPI